MLIALFPATNTTAQQMHLDYAVSHRADPLMPPPSRDFMFAIPANIATAPQDKTLAVYITSSASGTVLVQSGTDPMKRYTTQSWQVLTVLLPPSTEITTSGIVETKAVHIWSDQSDLTVHWLSCARNSAEGTAVMPTIAWGTDYVVGCSGSFFDSTGSSIYDWPSEFTVVADQDSTLVTINPSQCIRLNGLPTATDHCPGQPFVEFLNAGQVVQYQVIKANNPAGFDMTGTIVHANKPIGVTAATMCTNIPANFPSPNFIVEEMPPVAAWGNQYLSSPFITRKGGDTFLAIASKDSQTIYRTDYVSGKVVHCTLSKYAPFFHSGIDQPTLWESNAPFMLVQYMNSASWPVGSTNPGGPAEVVLTGLNELPKQNRMNSPDTTGGIGRYTTYANIICQTRALKSTLFDGLPIKSSKAHQLISPDTSQTIFVCGPVGGGNSLTSDSSVGENRYGFGNGAAYAWGGAMNSYGLHSTDTSAPMVTLSATTCDAMDFLARDSGDMRSGISYIRTDSESGMRVVYDSSLLRNASSIGSGVHSIPFRVEPTGTYGDGYITLDVVDPIGNFTQIRVTYHLQQLRIGSHFVYFQGTSRDTTIFMTIGDTNLSSVPYTLKTLELKSILDGKPPVGSGPGISIDSVSRVPVKSMGWQSTKLRFKGNAQLQYDDTLVIGNECDTHFIPLSTRPATDFVVYDLHFFRGIFHNSYFETLGIWNDGNIDVAIDSIWTTGAFAFAPYNPVGSLPFILKGGRGASLRFEYTPTSSGSDSGIAYFQSAEGLLRTAKLYGTSVDTSQADIDAAANFRSAIVAYPNPLSLSHTRTLTIRYPAGAAMSLPMKLYNSLGFVVASSDESATSEPGEHTASFDLPLLPPGIYYYRLEGGLQSQTGRIVIMP